MSNRNIVQVIAGMLIVCFFHVIYFVVVWLVAALVAFMPGLNYEQPLALFSIGIGLVAVAQLVYVIPLYKRYVRVGDPDAAKGVAIAAILTALLTSSCFFFLFNG